MMRFDLLWRRHQMLKTKDSSKQNWSGSGDGSGDGYGEGYGD